MTDLMQQMDLLRNLSDAQLAAEMKSPSAGAAPFLVAGELNRRKDMRQRYQAQAASKAPQTTVAADLLAQTPMDGGMGDGGMGGGMPSSGGLDAAMGATVPDVQSPTPGYASGGIVDAIDYNTIAKQYMDDLDNSAKDKDRAAALALLAAGAGIMGGGHSNTLANIGAGISAGLTSYQDALQTQSRSRSDTLQNLLSLAQAQQSGQLTREQMAQQKAIADEQIAAGKEQPANVKEFTFYKGLNPEDRKLYDQVNPNFNPNQLTQDQLLGAKMDAIYQDAQKKYPIQQFDDDTAAADKQRKEQVEAYKRIAATYGEQAAQQWAVGMGIPTGDLVTSGTGSVDQKDPLGLGL